MLTDFHIKNFRMLEDLSIPQLGRANLIVGKNNSGKSSLLEALRIYAWNAHVNLLQEILRGHNEFVGKLRSDVGVEEMLNWRAIENLFPNRKFPGTDGQPILFESSKRPPLRLEHQLHSTPWSFNPLISVPDSLIPKGNSNQYGGFVYQRIKVSFGESQQDNVSFGKSRSVEWLDLTGEQPKSAFFARNTFWLPGGWHYNLGYVPTQLPSLDGLSELWDNILMEGNSGAETVVNALQIIEPNIRGLYFVRDSLSPSPIGRVPVVRFENGTSAPLASMGEGMSRILQLILAAFSSRDGLFLVDEIENGLHYSVQKTVWELLFRLSKDWNFQIFATTHSWDCIESFTKVAVEDASTEGVLLKLARSRLTSDNGKVIARVYNEADLQTVTASDLEIR